MTETTIQPIESLTHDEIAPLIAESLSEDYSFIQRLWDEYESGVNRFDQPGEILMGIYEDERLIATGGINLDPYVNRSGVGRVRHVYVLNAYRRKGIGKRLLDALIEHARTNFDLLTLRTFTAEAAAFYVALGFQTDSLPPQSTHAMNLK